ncbi:TatD family hydrolase [Desulfobacterales bacterium HSG16]|nr:TatD family hydrolase [Desulfobacterales bacterium HSG16]
MKLFDSHCHLDDRSYDKDLDEVIDRMEKAGVAAGMVVGIHKESSKKAVEMADRHENLFASVGIHPHDAKSCSEDMLSLFKDLAKNPNVKAWGETGLDFNRMFSPREIQEKWLSRQIEIAQEINLPLIFHERDSNGRFLEMLKTHYDGKIDGVVHCFSGNKEELSQYLDLGLYIGITGILTIQKRGADLRKLVNHIPTDRILIETDAPYLTPAPEKNKTRRNEPAFVKSVFLKLAQVREIDQEILAEQIWKNTCRLYRVG